MIINVQSFIVILSIDIPGIDGYGLELLRISKGKLFLYQDDAKWPCVLSLDSTVPWVSPAAYSWWYQVRWSFFAHQPRPSGAFPWLWKSPLGTVDVGTL